MNAFWEYFWPLAALGLVIGAIIGSIALRRRNRLLGAIGIVAVLAAPALWHWPLGAGGRFAAEVDRTARAVLVDWEMTQVHGELHKRPLTRTLVLSGPADEFQRRELVRIMSEVPGVGTATWSGRGGLPILLEAVAASVLGFLVGLLLAYVIELRRRHNAQWRW